MGSHNLESLRRQKRDIDQESVWRKKKFDATKSKVNAWCTKRQGKPNQARSRWRLGVKSSVSTRRRARILTALFSDISALTEYIIEAYVFSEIIKE